MHVRPEIRSILVTVCVKMNLSMYEVTEVSTLIVPPLSMNLTNLLNHHNPQHEGAMTQS